MNQVDAGRDRATLASVEKEKKEWFEAAGGTMETNSVCRLATCNALPRLVRIKLANSTGEALATANPRVSTWNMVLFMTRWTHGVVGMYGVVKTCLCNTGRKARSVATACRCVQYRYRSHMVREGA